MKSETSWTTRFKEPVAVNQKGTLLEGEPEKITARYSAEIKIFNW